MTQTSDSRVFFKHIVSTISSKGQITLPASIRRYLGVNLNEKISFNINEKGAVVVVPAKFSGVSALRGAAGKLKKPLSWKKVKEIAREERFIKKYEK